MTIALSGIDVANRLEQQFPASITESGEDNLVVKSESIFDIISFLKNTPEFDFNYLSCITAVDYLDYFEVVYFLTSLQHNHSVVVKARCYGRENLSLPSIVNLYRGAEAQEREIYDLMGISFEGHPNMKRIFMWEGFQGHPQRKDFML
ncbi:NADH-quinone oxidoreductase subunit C [Chloroflexota bacterium]